MSMPSGDTPQKAQQCYHYLQSHQLVPHGRTVTWHVDWNSVAWMWGFVVVLVLLILIWVRQYRSTRQAGGIFPLDTWAGYAVSGKSVHYRRVSGSWTVPTGSCSAGERSDSVVWVGLGGLSTSSDSLEQTGTALTCTSSGQAVYSAWYELVPAGSHKLTVTVQPGDRISASVTIRGKHVRISLRDLTQGLGVAFTRSMSALVAMAVLPVAAFEATPFTLVT